MSLKFKTSLVRVVSTRTGPAARRLRFATGNSKTINDWRHQ
jgi:hypothetical protein